MFAGSILGVSLVNAQETKSNTTLVQRIAQRFGLNEKDVQSVFDQLHQEKQAEMQKLFEDRLTQLVNEGKITDNQKQLIISKHKEMMDKKQTNREDLKTWAEQNGIDMQYIFGGSKLGLRGGWKHW